MRSRSRSGPISRCRSATGSSRTGSRCARRRPCMAMAGWGRLFSPSGSRQRWPAAAASWGSRRARRGRSLPRFAAARHHAPGPAGLGRRTPNAKPGPAAGRPEDGGPMALARPLPRRASPHRPARPQARRGGRALWPRPASRVIDPRRGPRPHRGPRASSHDAREPPRQARLARGFPPRGPAPYADAGAARSKGTLIRSSRVT